MSTRRFAEDQPVGFSFSRENLAWAQDVVGRYPKGREASAIIPLLWRAQEQCGGWLPRPAVEYVSAMLGMPKIRGYEVATFYTMFNLAPTGKHHIQVCTTTPCWLRGSDEIVAACKKAMNTKEGEVSEDGLFSSPSPLPDGRILVAWRPGDGSASFGLYRLDPATGTRELVLDDPKVHETQARIVSARPRPDGRSSVVSMDDPLVGLDNCLIVPHIASASRATRGRMAAMAAANLLAGVRGDPLPTPVLPPP